MYAATAGCRPERMAKVPTHAGTFGLGTGLVLVAYGPGTLARALKLWVTRPGAALIASPCRARASGGNGKQMNKRSRLAALVGAGILTFAMVGAASAVKPEYGINVTKTANPANVAAAGASVTFTVWVENTGTGFFQVVDVADSLGGCTLGAPVATGGDSDGNLEENETWAYSCTVAGVTPGTSNTATVKACHSGGACDVGDANGADDVTVTLTGAGATGQPGTDTLAATGESNPSQVAWLLIAALGVLLGSIVVLSPSRIGRRR